VSVCLSVCLSAVIVTLSDVTIKKIKLFRACISRNTYTICTGSLVSLGLGEHIMVYLFHSIL
jgi:hypothetical protein